MADVTGIAITDITAFGWSDDGQQVWFTHKLRDGSEYRLVYPHAAAGQLLTMFMHATRSASAQRVSRDPREAAEGMDSNVLQVEEVRVGTAPGATGAIMHFTTIDSVPVALEIPTSLLRAAAAQLQLILRGLEDGPSRAARVH
jgi:hypothetical protein